MARRSPDPAPTDDLTEINRRAAEAGAAVTTAEARTGGRPPAADDDAPLA